MELHEIDEHGKRIEREIEKLEAKITEQQADLKESKDSLEGKILELRMLFRQKTQPDLPFQSQTDPTKAHDAEFKEVKDRKLLGPGKGRGHKKYKRGEKGAKS